MHVLAYEADEECGEAEVYVRWWYNRRPPAPKLAEADRKL